ncbi:calcium-binding protein [Jannaschia seohaensis]|uniref:Hemolysin type calcium-binding protein n=1 Tax=Jannaschia seohaensis TaxID=475081 RepID=A0A2Y9AU38_9RHOB|nr:calcium-binding protein [Jannaschia seohaensis]PWJ19345.1 hemolysin type calcium-binding protein [Jannaschia seohaensis]SSA46007.1 Hemolysin-type calcium-binding repeat-containing protein [Jannaschia seohaensis]
MANQRIFGTPQSDVLSSAGTEDTLQALGGDDFILQSGTGNRDWIARIDGGAGSDTFEVVIPEGADPEDTVPDFAIHEVDPILYGAYTHVLTHLSTFQLGGLKNNGRTLLRDVETLRAPDGTDTTLSVGALDWHAETDVQSFEVQHITSLSPGNLLGRTVASLSDGNVVKVFQVGEPGADFGKLGFRIIDGDGDIVLNSDLFGLGTRELFNPYEQQLTNGRQVTALVDGGFAITFLEQSTTVQGDRSQYLTQLKVQLFNADGTERGEALVVHEDPPGGPVTTPVGFSATTMEDGRLLVSWESPTRHLVETVVDLDGTRRDSASFELSGLGGFFPGAVALPDGYTSIYLDTTLRDRNNDVINRLIARNHTVDEATGAITYTGTENDTELFRFEPGVGIMTADYAALGNGNFAAAFLTTTRETVLATYVDGAVTAANPLPGQYSVSNGDISLTEAPGGGAYLALEVNDPNNPDGAVFGAHAMMIPIAQDGTLGTPANMSNALDDTVGNNLRPVVAATQDGVIAFWDGSGAEEEWVSYQNAAAYDATPASSAYADTILGTAGDDSIAALGGDDLVVQSAGIDRFDGGAGNDTFSVAGSGAHILSLADSYVATFETPYREALLGFENLVGSAEGDRLIGDLEANRLEGGGGDDTISGNGGEDTILGGEGTDTYLAIPGGLDYLRLDAAASVERLDLSQGPLRATSTGGDFDLSGITGYVNADSILGGNGDDRIIGTTRNDTIEGNSGDDYLDGGLGNDTLIGGSRTDTLIAGPGDDVLTGGTSFSEGNVFVFAPDFGSDVITDYQRSRDKLDFNAFTAAELAQITVTQQDTSRVATFHDGSSLTLENTARNYTPTGSLAVSGDMIEDATLRVDLGGITDTDGFSVTGTYQWLRDDVEIAGATAATYQLGQEDVGTQISVVYRYTDLFRTEEEVQRTVLTRVQNVDDALEGSVAVTGDLQEGAALSADISGLSDEDGIASVRYRWLRDGVEIDQATGETYLLTQEDVGAEIVLRATVSDRFGGNGVSVSTAGAPVTNVNDAPQGSPSVLGTARQGETLTAVTTGIADEDGLGAFSYQWLRNGVEIADATAETYLLEQADVGAAITLRVGYVDGFGTDESVVSGETAAIANINDLPEGAPTIDGLIEQRETLVARTDALTDADGLGAFAFQWLRNGAEITGANGQSYELAAEDVGTELSVQVSYTDGFGTPERVVSDPTGIIVAGDDVLEGTAGNDTLQGSPGADTLNGGSGADTMEGGGGDDTYIVDDQRDRVRDTEGFDSVILEQRVKFRVEGTGVERVEAAEGGGNSWIFGDARATEMIGNEADNILISGGGNDTMTGGAGRDYFAFQGTAVAPNGTITDFDASDKLLLDDQFFGLGNSRINLRPLDRAEVLDLLDNGLAAFRLRTKELSVDIDGPDGPEGLQIIATFEGRPALGLDDVMLF